MKKQLEPVAPQQFEEELDKIIGAGKAASTFFGRLKLLRVLKRARRRVKYDDYLALQNKVMEAIKASVADQLIKKLKLDEDVKGGLLKAENPGQMWTIALELAFKANAETAGVDPSKMSEVEQLRHYFKRSMKAAYWDCIKYIQNPKYKDLGWADPQRTYTEPKDFLYPSEEENLLREMDFSAFLAIIP